MSDRRSEHRGVREQSKQGGASKQEGGASKRASGPVLQSVGCSGPQCIKERKIGDRGSQNRTQKGDVMWGCRRWGEGVQDKDR